MEGWSRWTRAWDVFAPHLGDGSSYINHFSGDERPEQVRASYGSDLERLRQPKSAYDPANTFRMNPNINPDERTVNVVRTAEDDSRVCQ